jgi:hypothetical protein
MLVGSLINNVGGGGEGLISTTIPACALRDCKTTKNVIQDNQSPGEDVNLDLGYTNQEYCQPDRDIRW